MNWFLTALKSYAVFSGRSRRSEYWYFALFYLIFYAVAAIVDAMAGTFDRATGIGIFTGILTLAFLIPSLSVSVRRLHDTGRTGWWLLIAFIPVVGAIVLLVFLAQNSAAGANRFGANPKAGPIGRSFQAAPTGKPWAAPQARR
jgi:uncharacterized membrane protein YhaH (DUF805 family)